MKIITNKFLASVFSLSISIPPAIAQRAITTGNLAFYVAPPSSCATGYWGSGGTVTACGSDTAGNGTQAAPWATCQHAVTVLYSQYDWQGLYAPTINMASKPSPGQFFYPRCSISGRMIGQPGSLPPFFSVTGHPTYAIGNYNPFVLRGDPANRLGAFLVSGDSGNPADGPALSLTDGAGLKIVGLTFDSGQSFQDNIDAMYGATLEIDSIALGNAGQTPGTYNINIGCAFNCTLMFDPPTVQPGINSVGSAASLIQLGAHSTMIANNNTGQTGNVQINLSGGTFTSSVMQIDDSEVYNLGFVWTGIFAGTGYTGTKNAVVENGTGIGPRTCQNLILGHTDLWQDNSVCR
jgi:hypothetical protein